MEDLERGTVFRWFLTFEVRDNLSRYRCPRETRDSAGTLAEIGAPEGLLFVVTPKGARQIDGRPAGVESFAGSIVDCFPSEGGVEIGKGDNLRRGEKVAGVAPESTEVFKALRDTFLRFFIEIFAEVGTAPHFPLDKIGGMTVECPEGAVYFVNYSRPGIGHEATSFVVGSWEIRKKVDVRTAATLELSYPEILNMWKFSPNGYKKGIEILLELATVRRPFFVIG